MCCLVMATRTAQSAVMGQYGVVEESFGNYHFCHCEHQLKLPGIEPRAPLREDTSINDRKFRD
jgi:hypothetical protein